MATTVGAIAAKAYDNVAAAIGDAVQTATIGAQSGRVVFEREKAPSGFPMPDMAQRMQSAWLEGFTVAPVAGDVLQSGGVDYYVMSVNDVVKAGTFFNVLVSAASDLLWKTVAVQEKVRVSDGAGGSTYTMQDVAGLESVSAGLMQLSGTEDWNKQRRESSAEYRMIMAYSADVNATQQILMDGRSYGIEFVDNSQKRGTWLMLDLTEGRNVAGA